MIGKRFRPLPFIFANDNYTLSNITLFLLNLICSWNYWGLLFPILTIKVHFLQIFLQQKSTEIWKCINIVTISNIS